MNLENYFNGCMFAFAMKIVSACLAGIQCRYDGAAKESDSVMELMRDGKAIPVCPEQLGGLATPRVPAEWMGDRVMTRDGDDVTDAYVSGCREALKIALLSRCDGAILKSRSPACGCGLIYDGSFSGTMIEGDGLFTKLLKERGIDVQPEKDEENKTRER